MSSDFQGRMHSTYLNRAGGPLVRIAARGTSGEDRGALSDNMSVADDFTPLFKPHAACQASRQLLRNTF